jgi:hypothetical protein
MALSNLERQKRFISRLKAKAAAADALAVRVAELEAAAHTRVSPPAKLPRQRARPRVRRAPRY